MTALVPMLALLAWLIVPSCLAALTLDRIEARSKQRQAIDRSRAARTVITRGGTSHVESA